MIAQKLEPRHGVVMLTARSRALLAAKVSLDSGTKACRFGRTEAGLRKERIEGSRVEGLGSGRLGLHDVILRRSRT